MKKSIYLHTLGLFLTSASLSAMEVSNTPIPNDNNYLQLDVLQTISSDSPYFEKALEYIRSNKSSSILKTQKMILWRATALKSNPSIQASDELYKEMEETRKNLFDSLRRQAKDEQKAKMMLAGAANDLAERDKVQEDLSASLLMLDNLKVQVEALGVNDTYRTTLETERQQAQKATDTIQESLRPLLAQQTELEIKISNLRQEQQQKTAEAAMKAAEYTRASKVRKMIESDKLQLIDSIEKRIQERVRLIDECDNNITFKEKAKNSVLDMIKEAEKAQEDPEVAKLLEEQKQVLQRIEKEIKLIKEQKSKLQDKKTELDNNLIEAIGAAQPQPKQEKQNWGSWFSSWFTITK